MVVHTPTAWLTIPTSSIVVSLKHTLPNCKCFPRGQRRGALGFGLILPVREGLMAPQTASQWGSSAVGHLMSLATTQSAGRAHAS